MILNENIVSKFHAKIHAKFHANFCHPPAQTQGCPKDASLQPPASSLQPQEDAFRALPWPQFRSQCPPQNGTQRKLPTPPLLVAFVWVCWDGCVRACVRVWVRARACVRACVRAYVRARVRACVRVCVSFPPSLPVFWPCSRGGFGTIF